MYIAAKMNSLRWKNTTATRKHVKYHHMIRPYTISKVKNRILLPKSLSGLSINIKGVRADTEFYPGSSLRRTCVGAWEKYVSKNHVERDTRLMGFS
jgi:hypothetical protein